MAEDCGGYSVRCFGMREVADAIEEYAFVAGSEVFFPILRFTRRIAGVGDALNHECGGGELLGIL